MPINSSKNNNARKPFAPTPALVMEYVAEWNAVEKSQTHARALFILFQEQFPLNGSLEHVLIKVSVLNDFFATRILDTYGVAKHLVALDIDKALIAGDPALVEKIRYVKLGKKYKDLYSFSSKYCAMHRPDQYPLWDSYVDRMLRAYRKKLKFASFRNAELKDYPRFIEITDQFRIKLGLQEFSVRQIDAFLWQYGKKCFPRKRNKKKPHS